jgi:hypothetical protein
VLNYSHRDLRSSLTHFIVWKSTFEYFSFAHFIDIVLVVQITFIDGIFNVVVYVFDEDEKLRGFHEEGEEDKWLIQNEFVDNFSFKISSPPPAHRICGFNMFTRFSVTSEYSRYDAFHIEIRNNTSGRYLLRQASIFPIIYAPGVREFQSLMHMKLFVGDPTFDNGDDVSISVLPHDPAIQIKAIGVQWLHEEEGKNDDIQSKDEVINAHNSSDDDDDDDDDDDAAHVAKVEIASRIFRNYYCALHGNIGRWYFAKKGLKLILI